MKTKRSNKQPTPPALASVSGSAAPPPTSDSEKRDWLRLVVMVENTEANRAMYRILPEEGRRLAERFQGKRTVKCEALQVWAMSHTKEEPPKAEAQQNAALCDPAHGDARQPELYEKTPRRHAGFAAAHG